MEAVKNLTHIKNNWSTYHKWETDQLKGDAKKEQLLKTNPPTQDELKNAKKYGQTLINAVNIMDQLSINKSENAMVAINSGFGIFAWLAAGAGTGLGYLASKLFKGKSPKIAAYTGYCASAIIGAGILEFISAHYEKMATRVARFQTRNQDLKDPRNFVIYTDEQIEKAKEIARNMDTPEDITADNTFKESFNPVKTYKKSLQTINELKNSYEEYKIWHKEYTKSEEKKHETFEKTNYTPEELTKAQKDKDKILSAIKKLEISANNYEINADLAIHLVAIASSCVGLIGGFLLSRSLGRLADKKALTGALKKGNFIDYLSKAAIPAGIIGSILAAGPLVRLSKESSRLGRHRAKEELLNDERNFIAHSDEEKKKLQFSGKIESKPEKMHKQVLKDFKAIFNLKQEFKEYQEFRKNRLEEELKLQKALKEVEISPQQLEDAKVFQKQVFTAFEKIDDKAESFVDDTNAALNSTKQIVAGIVCAAANIVTLCLFGKKLSKYTKNKEIPGFFEGLKLSKNLTMKELTGIFIAPFVATRLFLLAMDAISTEIKKKACKIGIMSAMKDLDDPRNFVVKSAQKSPLPEEKPAFSGFQSFLR